LTAFDYLDSRDRDGFGRGRFDRTLVARPAALADIPRRFYRFGRSREDFQRLLAGSSFDVVLVQTVMTYWYLGVREVIEDIRNVGFESSAYEWQRKTGGKVYSEEFAAAVRALREAGASSITAYIIIGHPDSQEQDLGSSIRFAAAQGAHVMLSEFAPIPGTPVGDSCRSFTTLDEPLNHNKTAFTLRFLGQARVDRLKALCREVNRAGGGLSPPF